MDPKDLRAAPLQQDMLSVDRPICGLPQAPIRHVTKQVVQK